MPGEATRCHASPAPRVADDLTARRFLLADSKELEPSDGLQAVIGQCAQVFLQLAQINHCGTRDRPLPSSTQCFLAARLRQLGSPIPRAASWREAAAAQPRLANGLAGLGCRMVPTSTSKPDRAVWARLKAKCPTPTT